MTLTEGQKIAVEKIQNFLKSDAPVFRLEGPAGYGKTTVIKMALKTLLDSDAKYKPVVPSVLGITFSHKAKNVLMGSIPNSMTFAAAYGFKEYIHENGRREFRPKKGNDGEEPMGLWNIPVFVHDEISQYSESMKKIMFEKTSMFSKIILMGDMAQLPPISDSPVITDADSPLFDIPIPEEYRHVLTEPVRQKESNPMLKLAKIIREEIFGNQDVNRIIMEILQPKLLDNEGWVILNPKQMLDEYLNREDYLNNKVIAYRNEKGVLPMNQLIRSKLFPNCPEKLVPDDLVFMTNNFMNKQPKYKLNNSEEFVIKNVTVKNYYPAGQDDYIESYFGLVDAKNFGEVAIITPTEDGQHFYNERKEQLIADANMNGSLWKRFYQFTDSFCDFTMGYALTAYRSQGSTYDNVYVDLIDILQTKTLTPKRRLQTIYTAITRARKQVAFIKP